MAASDAASDMDRVEVEKGGNMLYIYMLSRESTSTSYCSRYLLAVIDI